MQDVQEQASGIKHQQVLEQSRAASEAAAKRDNSQ